MSGINKVILVGNLGNDPEVRYSAKGAAIANITIATSEKWTDKESGQKQEKTEWHRVVGFNRLGEIMGEHLKKGSKVYIEGKLQTRKWQDNNGQDRYTTEIVANVLQMLDSRGRDSGTGEQSEQHASGNRSQENPTYGAHSNAAPASNFDDFDDLPF